ncbi:unnamed protein product [Amoebophrya sp. A120]|nr:unnamed protein product [Amoebophrya sp. A120]|eukprot:GSA120T00015705001.1
MYCDYTRHLNLNFIQQRTRNLLAFSKKNLATSFLRMFFSPPTNFNFAKTNYRTTSIKKAKTTRNITEITDLQYSFYTRQAQKNRKTKSDRLHLSNYTQHSKINQKLQKW